MYELRLMYSRVAVGGVINYLAFRLMAWANTIIHTHFTFIGDLLVSFVHKLTFVIQRSEVASQ